MCCEEYLQFIHNPRFTQALTFSLLRGQDAEVILRQRILNDLMQDPAVLRLLSFLLELVDDVSEVN